MKRFKILNQKCKKYLKIISVLSIYMTGEDLNIKAILKQYYQNKYREALGTLHGSFREALLFKQREGFKNPESIRMKCCEQKSLINDGGEVVCKCCGHVSHYEMVNEGFIDYYENLYRIRRKSKYQRKYHINNVLIDKLLQNHIYLTVEAENKLIRIFNQVVTLFFRLYSSRKRLIKFNFIFYKIFSEVKSEGFSTK